MNRRHFLGSLGTLATASVLTELPFGTRNAFAANSTTKTKTGDSLVFTQPAVLKALAVLQEKAAQCASLGKACIQHCQEELAEGHKEFVLCAQTAHQMVPLCDAVATLAAYKATVLKQVLGACISACDACITACKEHEAHFAHGMHLACKACLQSCMDCKAECEKLQKLI